MVRKRPLGRIFLLLAAFLVTFLTILQAMPATTTVTDVVYRADGTPAGGVLVIQWPAFTTIDGAAVGAGTKSVTLGAGGTLSVQLVPNSNANPASTMYIVTYQLDDGTSKTEFWRVGSASR